MIRRLIRLPIWCLSSQIIINQRAAICCCKTFRLQNLTTIYRQMSFKVDTPNFQTVVTQELKQVIQIFQENDYQIRLVGGVVRDLLLDQVPKDIDLGICTNDNV